MATRVRKPASTKSLSLETSSESLAVSSPRRRPPTRTTGSTTAPTRSPSSRRAASSSGSHRPLNLADLEDVLAPLPDLDEEATPKSTPPSVAIESSAPAQSEASRAEAGQVILSTETLSATMEKLREEFNHLREVVQENAQRGSADLSRNAHQTVLMVTGVAHHLDKVAAQLVDLATVVRLQAQTLSRVESSVLSLQECMRTQIALTDSRRLPPAPEEKLKQTLDKALAPLFGELAKLVARSGREASLEQVDKVRLSMELKQLKAALATAGTASTLAAVVPRAVTALRSGRK